MTALELLNRIRAVYNNTDLDEVDRDIQISNLLFDNPPSSLDNESSGNITEGALRGFIVDTIITDDIIE